MFCLPKKWGKFAEQQGHPGGAAGKLAEQQGHPGGAISRAIGQPNWSNPLGQLLDDILTRWGSHKKKQDEHLFDSAVLRPFWKPQTKKTHPRGHRRYHGMAAHWAGWPELRLGVATRKLLYPRLRSPLRNSRGTFHLFLAGPFQSQESMAPAIYMR